jgi:hypothetical protein
MLGSKPVVEVAVNEDCSKSAIDVPMEEVIVKLCIVMLLSVKNSIPTLFPLSTEFGPAVTVTEFEKTISLIAA